jgi:hypothetical protein
MLEGFSSDNDWILRKNSKPSRLSIDKRIKYGSLIEKKKPYYIITLIYGFLCLLGCLISYSNDKSIVNLLLLLSCGLIQIFIGFGHFIDIRRNVVINKLYTIIPLSKFIFI